MNSGYQTMLSADDTLCHHVPMTALLRAIRRKRGLTLEKLAAQTGVTKSYLSKIERQRSTPSIAVAIKVARVLNVDVGQLFSERRDAEKIVVDRAADRGGHQRYRVLAGNLLGKSMSPFVVQPTGVPGPDPQPVHVGQEFVFVHVGTVELSYGDQTVLLTEGDSAYLDASVSHRIRRIGEVPAEVLVVTTDDPGGGPVGPDPSELLFSYGTLQQPEVQLSTFGREVDGHPDAIVGFDLHYVTITDPEVVAASGSDRHPILRRSASPDAAVTGTVFSLSAAELAAADAYEVDAYQRIRVPLRSGPHAWVYAFAD